MQKLYERKVKGLLYKGYVETKDKQCVEKFKGKSSSELKTYEEVKNLPEFAGILSDDTILVDVDDSEQSEILMTIVEERQLDCRVVDKRIDKARKGRVFVK